MPSDAGYPGRPGKTQSGAMADIRMPMTKLPAQGREYMPKITTIDHTSVLEMALVGYEMQRNRIEAAIAEIQAELGQGGSSRSTSTVTASIEPKPTRKKRFSAAARKRMAAAQKKRWQLLRAKKAAAKKTKPTVAPKRRKVTQETARPGEGGKEGGPEDRERCSKAEGEEDRSRRSEGRGAVQDPGIGSSGPGGS